MESSILERGFQIPLDILKKRSQCYRRIDMRIAAVRVRDSWCNIRTRILLRGEMPENGNEELPTTDDFKIIREEIPPQQLGEILAKISQGQLDVEGTKVVFWETTTSPQERAKPTLQYESYCSRDSRLASQRWGISFPVDEFRLSVPHHIQYPLERVTLQLRCSKKPYEDIFEAVNEALELRDVYRFRQWNGHNESVLYLLMPNYVALYECKLKRNELRAGIRFHQSIDIHNLRLNIIAKGKRTWKKQWDLSKARIRKEAPYYIARKTGNVEGTPDLLLCLFEHGKEFEGPADEFLILNEATLNRTMIAHEHFDRELGILKKWLTGEGEDPARDFEMSVSILLHLCGFRVEYVGYKGFLRDTPDILAFSPTSKVIVGECMIDVPDDRKIRIVAKRAKQLKEKMRTTTLPVIFIGLSTEEVGTTVFQTAYQENVKVLSYEDLELLLERYARTEATDDVLSYIMRVTHSGRI